MSTEQKFECVFCQDIFEDKETLQIHFRKHGDRNFDLSTKCIRNRIQNEAVPVEKFGEETEMVGCDVCQEVFPTISKAITHKHKAHPDHEAKYFCSFCGKLFTMKHLLNKHIQSNHISEEVTVSQDYHCDVCEVTFHVPSAMLYHNKFFHRQDTDIPAIGYSKKVKLLSQEMIQIYYCSFCGEEFNNKVNLHKHTSEDHCDENHSPTEVLRCPLCEAIFYHLDAYELHLTFHSSEDLYSEKNELVEQITEFSLETVAPIIENVEEEHELQPDEDNTMSNPDEINNFLQLVMGEQADNVKVKHKKHKKHKKSKKPSITLDEFLNMNKDVFGDGLGDVQGIEEVPTQVVLKKVKGKAQNKNETKMVNADLAKLKKQGIIVKSKSKNNAAIRNLNTHLSKQQNCGSSTGIKKNITHNSPNDILNKLLNQGNNQIKIVKKSVSQNVLNQDGLQSDDNHINKTNFDPENECGKDVMDTSNIIDNKSDDLKFNASSEMSNVTDEITDKNKGDMNDRDINGKDMIESTDTDSKERNSPLKNDISMSNSVSVKSNKGNPIRAPGDTKHNILEKSLVTDTKKPLVDNNKLSFEMNDKDKKTETNFANKTISALKHLSHLITVKPLSNQSKDLIKSTITEENNLSLVSQCNSETIEGHRLQKTVHSEQKMVVNKPLKLFNEQISIKSPKKSPLNNTPAVQYDSENMDENIDNPDNVKNLEKKCIGNLDENIIQMKELKVQLVPLPQRTCTKILLKNESFTGADGVYQGQPAQQEEKDVSVDCSKEASNLDILKRLPNVTAKPINVIKSTNQQTSARQLHTYATQVKGLVPKNFSKGIDEDLEVYNIDDSDEDAEENVLNHETESKMSSNFPTDALRNLSKNITIKSSETKSNSNVIKDTKLESNSMRSETYRESYTQIKQSKEIQKSINLQNKLKTLGNITVKSRNSSPNVFNTKQDKAFEDFDEEAYESGSDSEHIGRVKITEVNEEYVSDSDLNDVHTNPDIESPNASNSEPEDNQEDINEYSDPEFETHIKANTVKKNEEIMSKKPVPRLENLINFNKALTIKSINAKNLENDTNISSQKEVSEDTGNPNLEMALKPYKSNLSQSEQSPNKNIQQTSGSANQTSTKQKVNMASNQVNKVKTVNTVKRFQSQTVIEEITTTVTKTIRTVNSSTNEVTQATSQNAPKIINKPQKIINKQPSRELQGTAVRHASPTIGTKIRNAVPVMRNPNTSVIRPSNQLVPIRPVFNRPRCPTPSTSAVRKSNTPRCSLQKPAIGKLKISPHALNQTIKRPSDEAFGQFPSFKKPKDTLAATPELPDYNEDDSSVHYSSATQSRTDFSSVTKSIKGKGMMTATQTMSEVSTSSQQQMSKNMATATQMRTEMCTSSQQQLSKLSNMSGLKVVKTSTKQAMQVEEKCEISPDQRNTLQALEKLQKQGLLVKKPRIEEYNDQVKSYSESDDEIEK